MVALATHRSSLAPSNSPGEGHAFLAAPRESYLPLIPLSNRGFLSVQRRSRFLHIAKLARSYDDEKHRARCIQKRPIVAASNITTWVVPSDMHLIRTVLSFCGQGLHLPWLCSRVAPSPINVCPGRAFFHGLARLAAPSL